MAEASSAAGGAGGAASPRSEALPTSEPPTPQYENPRSSMLRSSSAYVRGSTSRSPSPVGPAGQPAKRRSEPGGRSRSELTGLLSAVPERLRPQRKSLTPESAQDHHGGGLSSERGSFDGASPGGEGGRFLPRSGPSFRPKHIVTSADLLTEDMVAAPRAFSPRFLVRSGSSQVGFPRHGSGHSPASPRSPPASPLRRSFTTPGGKLFKRASWDVESEASVGVMEELAVRLERIERQTSGLRLEDVRPAQAGSPAGTPTDADSLDDFASARGYGPGEDDEERSLGNALDDAASPRGFRARAGVPLERQMSLLRREAKVNEWQRRLEQQEADLCAFAQNAASARRQSRLSAALSLGGDASPRSPFPRKADPRTAKASSEKGVELKRGPMGPVAARIAGWVFDPQGSEAFALFAAVLMSVAILGAAEAPLVWGFRATPRGAWRAFSACGDGLFVVNVCLGPLTGQHKGAKSANFEGSYLGRFPVVSADFWTSDHLSERFRSMDVVSGTRARGTSKLKRR